MNTDQVLRDLGPRIKLLRRHMFEWNVMLIRQRQVRDLTQKQTDQRSDSPDGHQEVIMQRMIIGALRLAQLRTRQTEECQCMKVRHQQEEVDLEQAISIG